MRRLWVVPKPLEKIPEDLLAYALERLTIQAFASMIVKMFVATHCTKVDAFF